MAINEGLFSSSNDEWTTPRWLFNDLNARFQFTLDAAASDENHLCPRWFTKEDSGLDKSWAGERIFCNPPYSKIRLWAEKFAHEAENGATLIAALIPARVDTRWWHSSIARADFVYFVPGRLHFSDKGPAPFPSALAFWLGLKDICKRGRRG